jgi:hypothetical protein
LLHDHCIAKGAQHHSETPDLDRVSRKLEARNMLPTMILVDGAPRCVIRPNDKKDLDRFVRNAKKYLLAGNEEAKVTHRPADDAESAKWKEGLDLHKAWGGADDTYIGLPIFN